MADTTAYLKPIWNEITRQVKIDKVYLETHRDLLIVDQHTLDIAKKFFKDRGVEVAGGITLTISEPNRFQTFCYSNPDDRKKSKRTERIHRKKILTSLYWTISFSLIVKMMEPLKKKEAKPGRNTAST